MQCHSLNQKQISNHNLNNKRIEKLSITLRILKCIFLNTLSIKCIKKSTITVRITSVNINDISWRSNGQLITKVSNISDVIFSLQLRNKVRSRKASYLDCIVCFC